MLIVEIKTLYFLQALIAFHDIKPAKFLTYMYCFPVSTVQSHNLLLLRLDTVIILWNIKLGGLKGHSHCDYTVINTCPQGWSPKNPAGFFFRCPGNPETQ